MKYIFLSLLPIFLSQLLFGQINVTIISPENNLADTSILTVRANVTSVEYEITTIIATIENRSVSLINIGPYFQGIVSTSGLTIGNTYVLSITATDVMGNQRTVTKDLIIDPPPKISIQLPVNHEVATPQLQLKAVANDNSDCSIVVSLQFYLNNGNPYRVVDTFINAVDTIISLSDSIYQGGYGYVRFTAIDSRGQASYSERKIYIEKSPYLERVFSTEGIISDFNYGKVLSYFEYLGMEANKNGRIGNINTGVISEIPSAVYDPGVGLHAYLTPTGAVLMNENQNMRDWNNDSLYALGLVNSHISLIVAGAYTIWCAGANLYVRNTSTASTKLISTNAVNWGHDVAPNGTVVYMGSDGYVYRYSSANDASTRITNTGGSQPLTDGKLIVYTGAGGIYVYANSTYIPLSSYSAANQREDYRVENGFVAYVKPGTLGQKQIWLRDTAGVSSQITFFSNSSVMLGLAPDGSICFYRNQENSSKYLYDKNTNKIKAISTSRGKTYYRDSAWYVSIGRVLFKVKSNFINSYYSVNNGNWSNPATWYGNTVPPDGADVVVKNNVTVDMNATCNSLTVNNNALVTVNDGINLTVVH